MAGDGPLPLSRLIAADSLLWGNEDESSETGVKLDRALDNDTDNELIRKALEGDQRGFEAIIERYAGRVFQVAGRFFRRQDEVEEAAQQTFVRLHSNLTHYNGKAPFEYWLIRLTRNVCLNILRSQKRRRETAFTSLTQAEKDWLLDAERRSMTLSSSGTENQEATMIARQLAEKLLDLLEPEDRLVLRWLDAEGYTVQEVSNELGWTSSKVKVRAFRARKKLRERIEKTLNEERSR